MIGRGWEFWIDRGGTFTDVVARSPAGELTTLKLLSVDPERYDDAAVAGIERLLAAAPAGERRIAAVKMGTTVATNALLERRGEPTVLVITAGLEDAIRIGGQQRPEIFALEIALPEMLYVRVVGAVERIDAQGQVQEPLDTAKLRADLEAARASGARQRGDRAIARVSFSAARARRRGGRALARFQAGLRLASRSAAAEARRARRHDARRCVLVAGARSLCRERAPRPRRRERRRAALLHAEPWRARSRRALPR